MPTFAKNEITLGDFPRLADADLRELGLPMGSRKRLLAGRHAKQYYRRQRSLQQCLCSVCKEL